MNSIGQESEDESQKGVTIVGRTVYLKKWAWIAIVLAVVVSIGLSVLDKIGTRRAIAGIRAPFQTETDKGMFQVTVAGYKTVIDCKYAYDIEALVAHTKDYFSWDVGDQLSPRDLTLIWGRVAQHNTDVDFHWSQMTRRTMLWLDGSVDQEALFGGEAGVQMCLSNNHIIPADDDVRWKLKIIRTGDHIRLRGYLVYVDGLRSDGATFSWYSSTTRTDTGDGACEVIYATDIEWL